MTNETLTLLKKLVSVSGWWPITVEPFILNMVVQRGENFGRFIIGLAFANVRVLIYELGLVGVAKRENDWRIFPIIPLNRPDWREDKLYGLLLSLVELRQIYTSSSLFETHFDRKLCSLGIGGYSGEVFLPLEIGSYLFDHPKALKVSTVMRHAQSSAVRRIAVGYSEENETYGFNIGNSCPLVIFPESVIEQDDSLTYHWECLLGTLSYDFGMSLFPCLSQISKHYTNLFDFTKVSKDFRKSLENILKDFGTQIFPRTHDDNKDTFLTFHQGPRAGTTNPIDFLVKVEGRIQTPSQMAYVALIFWMNMELLCSPKEFEIVTSLFKNQLGKPAAPARVIQEQANALGANWIMSEGYLFSSSAGFILNKGLR
jgi:hypothetical protein